MILRVKVFLKTAGLFVYGNRFPPVIQALHTHVWSIKVKHKWPKLSGNNMFRGFNSWQVSLDLERKRWQTASFKYNDLAAALKKRLDLMHEKYPITLERKMRRHGDYMYFEEDGCIYRIQPKNGEESLEILLSSEEVGLNDRLIQRIRVSPDHAFMAVSFKSSECEESTCVVIKLMSVPKVTYCIANVFSFEWVTNSILFHTKQENLQCRHVYLTDFNKENTPKLVYTEQDPRFFVDIYRTRDERYLTINSNSKNTSEVWLVDNGRPFESPILVRQRAPGIIYHVEHRNGHLYILTTFGEPAEYKLMKTPLSSDLKHWQLVYNVKEKTRLVDMEMLTDHCVMFLKDQNHLYLDVISLANDSVTRSIKPPVHFVYALLENRLSVEANHRTTDTETYRTIRLEAKSKDGTSVPITIFYKTCSDGLSRKPLLIHVYGAYGMDLNMGFKAEKRLLIDDGWILAYCHVRGGGELGCYWHKDGNLDKKQNGLDDLQACIIHLHELGYSQHYYTALEASSAGGVLAGALLNSSPQLFRAMVLEAPFLDVLNTMMDTSLPLTIEEQEEWGNPLSGQKYHTFIKGYCPYQNIKPQNYPSVLITAYENDQRVALEGLLRYVIKFRNAVVDYSHSSNMSGDRIPNIFLDVQPGGSHCDSLFWEDSLHMVARHLAFLHTELKLGERNALKKER
ncbi:hypothetical protein FKM82_010286 [Ascaphus truei]